MTQISNDIDFTVTPSISFIKKYNFTSETLTLFSGSSTDGSLLDGALGSARYVYVSDIATLTSGTQRLPITSSSNRWYLLDANTIRMIHECSLEI